MISRTESNRIDANLITSIYGRPVSQLQKWADNDLLLYVNDLDRTEAALPVRLQLPSVVTASDSNIRYKSQSVNETVYSESVVPQTEKQRRKDELRARMRRGTAFRLRGT